MIKIGFKVFANILLLILAVISIRATMTAFEYTGKPWPEEQPIAESLAENHWLCVGVSKVSDRIPANQLDPEVEDDYPITIKEFRSYFSYRTLEQVTLLQKEDDSLIRFEQSSSVFALFRLAVYVLGWVGLVRFFVMLPRWYRRLRYG